MSVNYSVTVRNNRLQQVINALDAGSSHAVLRLLDASSAVLSSVLLAKPSASVAAGLLTFLGTPLIDAAASASGTAVSARCEDSAGTVVISGLTVSTSSSTDLVFGPTNAVTIGQSVTITGATITGN